MDGTGQPGEVGGGGRRRRLRRVRRCLAVIGWSSTVIGRLGVGGRGLGALVGDRLVRLAVGVMVTARRGGVGGDLPSPIGGIVAGAGFGSPRTVPARVAHREAGKSRRQVGSVRHVSGRRPWGVGQRRLGR